MKDFRSVFTRKQLVFKLGLTLVLLFVFIVLYQAWHNWWTLLAFASAYLLGMALLFFDETYFYSFYEEKVDLPKQDASHFPELITRTVLFLFVLPLLSIFVVTSSGSLFGIALILALNWYLLIELWQLRRHPTQFKERFLGMTTVQVTPQLVTRMCYGASAYFCFLLLKLLA